MARPIAVGFAVAVTSLGLIAPSALAADRSTPPTLAPPDFPRTAWAQQMAAQEDLSVEEASRRLALQERSNGLVLKLKELLRDAYAGMWYDSESGDLRVGISPGADAAAVEQLLSEQLGTKPGDDWALVAVGSSRAELQAAQERIDVELQARNPIAIGWTAIDDVNNRVVLALGSDASDADRAWAKQVRSDFGAGQTVPAVASFPQLRGEQERLAGTEREVTVEVAVRQLDESARSEVRLDCNVSNHSCNAPLHGGARITSPAATCSAGFTSRWWSGSAWVPYVITAGHCMYLNPGSWQSIWALDGLNYPIGPRHTWRWGTFGSSVPRTQNDIGLITMNTAAGSWGWDQLQIPENRIVMWGWPSAGWDNWRVTSQGIAVPGDYGCRSGRTSNFTCGTVQFQSVSLQTYYEDSFGQRTYSWVGNNFTVPGACAQGGDSGGPFVNGGIGLGVLSSGACDTNYQHVWDAYYHFGVELYP